MSVHIRIQGPIFELVLDRPKVNAIDTPTSQELGRAFVRFRDDPDLLVAIITGAGQRVFSAGWDFRETLVEGADYGPGGYAGITELFDLTKPVIAAVNGYAVGGGFELALACDLMVCAEHAAFSLPETRRGLIADGGGAIRAPRRLPRPIAMELLLTGRDLSAQEAAHFGLVNRVAPADSLLDAARELAEQIAATAPLAVQGTMELVQRVEGLTIEHAYRRMHSGELDAYQRCLSSQDALEGPRAFLDKRPPVWTGR